MIEAGRMLPRARVLLDYLRAYAQQNRMSPTIQEMADHMGCSRTCAYQALMTLVDKGHVLKSAEGTRQYVPADIVRPGEMTISVILPGELSEALAVYSMEARVAPETVIREAVTAYLERA